jgi:hypothetical protein
MPFIPVRALNQTINPEQTPQRSTAGLGSVNLRGEKAQRPQPVVEVRDDEAARRSQVAASQDVLSAVASHEAAAVNKHKDGQPPKLGAFPTGVRPPDVDKQAVLANGYAVRIGN